MKKKVLFLIYKNEVGGMQLSLSNTMLIFEELGYNVEVIALYGSQKFSFNDNVITLSYQDSEPIDKEKLANVITSINPILLINFSCTIIYELELQIPIIERIAILNSYIHTKLPIYTSFAHTKNLVSIVCQNKTYTSYFKGSFEKPVYWIPNFISENASEKNVNIDFPNKLKIINISRNHPVKNIDAFVELSYLLPEYTFILVTTSKLKRAYPDNLIICIGLTDLEINFLLKNSDLYINFSLKEGISNATLKAFYYGLPAVITDSDGICNHLNGNCWVIDSFSVMQINQRYLENLKNIALWITSLLGNEVLLNSMSKKSVCVAKKFAKNKIKEKWKKLIKKHIKTI